jgi:hypothetical protein
MEMVQKKSDMEQPLEKVMEEDPLFVAREKGPEKAVEHLEVTEHPTSGLVEVQMQLHHHDEEASVAKEVSGSYMHMTM